MPWIKCPLKIKTGEKVALIGENGSGKTTLARVLNGLLQPVSGKIDLEITQPQESSPPHTARQIAYVFQNPDDQLFCKRVRDEIAFGPEKLGFSGEEIDHAIIHAMNLTGLSGLGEKHPYDLGFSGRKMVAIASALAMQTPILVFDEPIAGLDSGEIRIFSKVLDNIKARKGISVTITHDMNFVAEKLERALLLRFGNLIFDGKTRELFRKTDLIQEAGLELPLITDLAWKLGFREPLLCVNEFLSALRKRSLF